MQDQTSVFATAVVAHFGDRAHPFALEQATRAAAAGGRESTLSWTRIADGIASLQRAGSTAVPFMIDGADDSPDFAGPTALRQLLYVSVATRSCDEDALEAILRSSRNNNALYDVTGVLWSDGDCFIQVLEGPIASVEETYGRILVDDRHHSLALVYDHLVAKREFGSWSMCHRHSYETDDDYDRKIRRALAAAPDLARAALIAFIGSASGRRPLATT